ncbi:MAG: sigma-70 family RNA polymerase sigma factor [Planctomycetaceae bacterium]|nr:sigma-70 family RNA polymerase sigma factor [Planctomycetaceae bacterium]
MIVAPGLSGSGEHPMAGRFRRVISPQQLHDLWTRHSAALLLLARGHCGADSGGMAEDCVQEAFVRLATQSPPPDHPRAWLLTVVRNAAIDAVRKLRTRRSHEIQVGAGPEESQHSWFTADESSDGRRLCPMDVQEALKHLDDTTRDVVIAHLWNEMTFRQIAQAFDLSRATAHRIYESGIRKLKALLTSTTDESRQLPGTEAAMSEQSLPVSAPWTSAQLKDLS